MSISRIAYRLGEQNQIPEIKVFIKSQLIFNKGAKNI